MNELHSGTQALAEDQKPKASASEETALLIPARPKILVVDDESAARALLYIGLRRAGFLVSQAQSGAEAVELYSRQQDDIAIVLLDVCMPGLDGPQTLSALQAINPQVRFCFLNDSASSHSRKDLLGLGATFVFEKPLRVGNMVPVLRHAIDSQRKQPAAAEPPSGESASPAPAPRPIGRSAPVKPPEHERRAAVRYPCDLDSSCQPMGRNQACDGWPARVSDISTTGLGLVLGRRFEPGTLLVFELRTPTLSRVLLAHVVHVQALTEGNWMLGCILSHRLANEDIRDLADTTGDVVEVEDVISATPELTAV